MNKQALIGKINFITEELHQQTSEWIQENYQISPLEVDAYFSNIQYLQEQAQILKRVLMQEDTQAPETIKQVAPEPLVVIRPELGIPTVPVEMPEIHTTEDLMTAVENQVVENKNEYIERTEVVVAQELPVPAPAEEEVRSLNDRMSEQRNEHSLGARLKHHYLHKDLTFSLNEKFFVINQLFSGDSADFNRVIAHLSTLDTWEEVELYLNETCVIPYHWADKPAEQKQFFAMLKERFEA